jgi:hypothetical protein
MKMTRPFPWLGLVLGGLCLLATGCEPHGSWLRHKDDQDSTVRSSATKTGDADTSKMIGADPDEKKSESFFKGDRRSGGWSSEAREIEKDLGVN